MISVGASSHSLTSSPASCKSKVRANKRRTNGCGCPPQTVRIDPRRTPRLAIPPRAGIRPHRRCGNRFGHRRTAARMPHRNRRARLLRPHQSAALRAGRRHRAPGSLRAGGCRGCLLPPRRRRGRRATGAPALGALRAQRRTRPQSGRPSHPGRRLRTGRHGSGRYRPAHREAHFARFLVPPAPRRGTHTHHPGLSRPPIQRQDLRLAGDRVRPPRDNLVRRAFRLPPAARLRGARPIHSTEEAVFACLHGHGNLTALAFEFSPTVEATGVPNEPPPGPPSGLETVTFDVAGLDRLFGLPQDVAAAIARRAREVGVKANLALAGNPDAAICAARGFPGVSLIPHGDEGKFLATLPLALLSPAPQMLETLERWGIRRFREMAALPPLSIAERLGPEGLRLRGLARGEGDRKLLPLAEALHFEDEIELDYPVELLEPLAFLLARLINGLSTRLATRGLATDELRLRLKLETGGTHERCLRLPVPSLDTKAFLKLLQLDLEANPPAAPIVHLWMGVNPVKPQAAQHGLLVPVAPEPVKLELTLARIQAFVGEGRVGTPELLDPPRPDEGLNARQR